MGQLGLPSGTLGFVCSTIAVVCCSSQLDSVFEDPVYSDGNAQDCEIAAPASGPQRSTRYNRVPSSAISSRGMSQLKLFDSDLRFHGLDVHSALESAVDGDLPMDGSRSAAQFLTMRRITRIALNAVVPEDDGTHEQGVSSGGHKQATGRGTALIREMSPLNSTA